MDEIFKNIPNMFDITKNVLIVGDITYGRDHGTRFT